MNEKKINSWFFGISLAFIAIDLLLIAFNIYYFNLLPLVIIFAWLAIFRFDKLLLAIVFLVPFSVPLRYIIPDLPIDFYIPTEPMLFGIMLLFIFKVFLNNKIDRRILVHPVSITIYINLLWIFITSVTSTMPVVSFKFLTARLWFVIGFYFLAAEIFKKYKTTKDFFWLYLIAFLSVVLYSSYNLFSRGLFDQQAAHSAMLPFYNDHTSYGAIISMFIPGLLVFAFEKKRNYTGHKTIIWILAAILLFALVFSYSRAAWVSMVIALIVWLIIALKIKFRSLIIVIAIIVFYLGSFSTEIIMKLEKNKQESSDDMRQHIESISNIRSDASNVERLNRWSCVFKMFRAKPVTGWGPGTYMFQYAPFQMSYNRTIISTNFGTIGNAHSEYFGPLAESGLLGTLSFLAIIITVILTAIRVYTKAKNKQVRNFTLAIFLGLVTYFIHGTLNNFLDTDKASAPFWGFIAIIVAVDVFHKDKSEEELTEGKVN